MPQTDGEQCDGRHERKPAQTGVQAGHRNAFGAIAHGFLQRNDKLELCLSICALLNQALTNNIRLLMFAKVASAQSSTKGVSE